MLVLVLIALVCAIALLLFEQMSAEQVTVSHRKQAFLAKKYTRFSAQLAMGKLQTTMGRDTAVSSYGKDLFGELPARENWLSAWDTLAESPTANWLVSNATEAPTISFSEESYPHRKTETPAWTTSRAGQDASFAFWILDEGMKLPVAYATNPLVVDPSNANDVLRVQRLRQEGVSVIPWQNLVTGAEGRVDNPFAKWQGGTPYETMDSFYQQEQLTPQLPMTHHARMLLVDTAQGGFRQELLWGNVSATDNGFIVNQEVKDFLQHQLTVEEKYQVRTYSQNHESSQDGEPYFVKPLLMTECDFMLKVLPEGKGGWSKNKLRFFVKLRLETWSPFGFAPDVQNIVARVEDFPPVQLRYMPGAKEGEQVAAYTLEMSEDTLLFEKEIPEKMRGGELRDGFVLELQNSKKSGRVGMEYPQDLFWRVPSVSGDRRLEIVVPKGSCSISLYYFDEERSVVSSRLGSLQNIPISTLRKTILLDDEEEEKIVPVYLHGRVKSSWVEKQENGENFLDRLLRQEDLRRFSWDVQAMLEEKEPMIEVMTDSIDQDFLDEEVFRKDRFLSGINTNTYHRIFDLPAQPPISLGWLSHLSLKGYPSFAIGNSWGEKRNDIFDRSFLSGMKGTLDAPEVVNPYLLPLPAGDEIWWKEGKNFYWQAVNVNQATATVWQALLSGGTMENWAYQTSQFQLGLSSRSTCQNAFARLPHSAHLHNTDFRGNQKWGFDLVQTYPSLTDLEKVKVWTRGIQEADDVERIWNYSCAKGIREYTDSQIKDIAEALELLLRERKKPFFSLEEFVSDGWIQKAIDKTDVNTLVKGLSYQDATDALRVPKMSNLYLSQSDVMMRLAPIAAMRSDTFVIYAKASVKNSSLRKQQRTLRLLVQRTPQDEHLLGRPWKIIQAQWIN